MSTSPELGLVAAFMLGALGSSHCVVMCGGIACALGIGVERERRGPLTRALCLAGYQLGRVASYAIAGAALGALGVGLIAPLAREAAPQVMHAVQAATLIALGCYLTGIWRTPLAAIERLGARAWSRLAPLRAALMPVRHPAQALAFGLLWGWLPCGLVYSALLLALAAGDALDGALVMLAFGLGTLPAMLAVSALGARFAGLTSNGWLRRGAGVLVLAAGTALGVSAIAHAAGVPPAP